MHAAFLFAFFSFLRISSLVPYKLTDLVSDKPYFLKCSDVSFITSGAVLQVYRAKTIQFNQRVPELSLPVIPNSVLCPVSTLKNYLSLVPSLHDMPLFVVEEGSGIKPILVSHFNRFLKSCVLAAGFNPNHFSTLSDKGG